jgi:hypothetical protein
LSLLTSHELRKKLDLTPQRLARLVKQGLPAKGKGAKRRFDPQVVATWLRDRGLAKQEGSADQIATTIADAAREFGVAPRTFSLWLTDPTFPGKAGTPGRRDGYFPLQQIRAWQAAAIGGTRAAAADAEMLAGRRLKLQIDNDRQQVALEKELGSIADCEAIARFQARQVATAKALFGEAPDKVDSRLPGKLAQPVRLRIRQALEEVIAETLNALAELAAGDLDDAEDFTNE